MTAPDPQSEDGGGEGAPEKKIGVDLKRNIKSVNIAEDLDDNLLTQIGRDVVQGYEIDLESRKAEGWEENYDEALKLARQVKEEKTFPWVGASNVKYPLITVAAIQFAARSYPAIVDGYNVVKGKVLGEPDDAKRDRADRVARHMSWQLLEQQPEWEADTDALLHMLPVVGTVFRKTWFDPIEGRNTSEIISPEDLIVNYWAKAEPPRMTQVCRWYPNEVTSKQRAGTWLEIELGEAEDAEDKQSPHIFLEQHTLIDLDDDDFPEPYIVTVHKETARVVRIVARYDADGIKTNSKNQVVTIDPVTYYTKYVFMPSLDGSYYGMGFGALLNPLNNTVDSLINQLIDAGTLANTQGGFLSEGVQMRGGIKSFTPGEYKRVSVAGGSLKDSVLPLPVREPSQVLFNLLGMMIEAAKDITAVKDILTGETQGSNQAVGTTLAMIEQGLKVFTAIYKRIHRALKQELKLNYRLNALYLKEKDYFNFQDKDGVIARQDYNLKDVNVVPVSDPTIVTDMQKMARAQFLLEFQGKGLDDKEIYRRALTAASIEDVDSLFPKEPPQPPPEFVLKGQELDLKDRQTKIDEDKAPAELALIQAQTALAEAQAETVNLQARMADPQFYATLREMIMATLTEAMGGKPNADAQPAGMGGMAQPAPDQGVSPVPQGPPPEVGGPMGGGDGTAAPQAMGGADVGPVSPA